MKLTITPVAAAAIIAAATTTLAAPVITKPAEAARQEAITSSSEQTSLKRRWNFTDFAEAKGPLRKLFNDGDDAGGVVDDAPKLISIDTLITPQPRFPASGGYPSLPPKGTTSPGYPHDHQAIPPRKP